MKSVRNVFLRISLQAGTYGAGKCLSGAHLQQNCEFEKGLSMGFQGFGLALSSNIFVIRIGTDSRCVPVQGKQ